MKINLREEETNNYISLYKNFLEDIQKINYDTTIVLNEVMKESKYDKLQKLISDIMDSYEETIVNQVETNIFSNWEESDASLCSCLKQYRAGEAANEVCLIIEQQMKDLMSNILKIEKEEIIITDRPVINESGLETLENICKTSQSSVEDVRSSYISQIQTKTEENNIYGTLLPLIESISKNMEVFFETSRNQFCELHEFVQQISSKLHTIAEEYSVKSTEQPVNTATSSVNKKITNDLVRMVNTMTTQKNSNSFSEFKKITELLYNTISNEALNKKKKIPYSVIVKIAPIYRTFYQEYGNILKDNFKIPEEREQKEEFIKREYFEVIRDRKNETYFNKNEIWTFRSHAYRTYVAFYTVADMFQNIAIACEKGTANDINLMYGAYVLFNPILEGHIKEEDNEKFAEFSKWAAEELLKLLGKTKEEELADVENKKEAEEIKETNEIEKEELEKIKKIDLNSERFNEENMKLFVSIVEKIVNSVGVEQLNSSIEQYDTILTERRTTSNHKVSAFSKNTKSTSKKKSSTDNNYGRYTVTETAIQIMEQHFKNVDDYLEPSDKFFHKKMRETEEKTQKKREKTEKNLSAVNSVIHGISALTKSLGFGKLNVSNLAKKILTKDSEKSTDVMTTILNEIEVGDFLFQSLSNIGQTAAVINLSCDLWDKIFPYIKENNNLSKVNEKCWNTIKKDLQVSTNISYLDQYIIEHYEIKYDILKTYNHSYYFHYHNVIKTIENEYHRRQLENSIFAAERTMKNHLKNDIGVGIFLNLVRSGLCNVKDINSKTANKLVDKLYEEYMCEEKIKPKVETNPDSMIAT